MKKQTQLALAIIFLLQACSPKEITFKDAICIENITTIDSKNGIKENQTVILKDGKIFKVIPSGELQLSKNNTIIDGTGKYLIPGLWDAHVHFSYIEELAPRMFDMFLTYGVTSVRDTGGRIDFMKKWKEKSVAQPTTAPRVMISGPLLDGIPNVYDGSSAARPALSIGLNSIEAVAKQIHKLDSIGVDFLKAYEMLTPEQFGTITKLAKEKGLKVTGHIPLSMDVISASNAGLNSLEHMRNLDLSCASNADELLARRRQILLNENDEQGGVLRSRIHNSQRKIALQNYDDDKAKEVLRVLAKNKTWQIPTLALTSNFIEKPFNNSDWKKTFTFLPDSIEQSWKIKITKVNSTKIDSFRNTYVKWSFNMVKKIHQEKIDIMAGTDCPIFFLTPGISLHQELAMLVKAGLSPLEALKTATFNPAKYFNLENELGLIKETMFADLVILDANPLENIHNTKRINAVIKQGKYYSREKLNEIQESLSSNKPL
ncbi:MAG: amidohydrolase family protein [Cellulophaga sp.]